jgi:hypothetical protein
LDTRYQTLIARGNKLFTDKAPYDSLCQEIADHFYPERADFTRQRLIGSDYANKLMSSYPVLVRRELCDSFGSTLRPTELSWFETSVEDDEKINRESKAWLEQVTKTQRRAMYDRMTGFVRATKEGDHDYGAFGGAVISSDFNPRTNAMLYRTWHLRDCAWTEDITGQVNELHINWNPTVAELAKLFPGKLHETAQRAVTTEPNRKIKCRRIVLMAEDYHQVGDRWPHTWVSIYVDIENNHPLEEVSVRTRQHVIPRWQTVSGSPYPFSPATIVGLADARLIQAMTLTLLEAGEMAVRPPMLAAAKIVREDVQLYAGGITWIDAEHDKRKQDVLRPLNGDSRALPFGLDFSESIEARLSAIFYLNKLGLPPPAEGEMTAYEVRERIKEYLRIARPLFEPAENEYNGGLCEATFEELLPRGAFGPLHHIPRELRGRGVRFKFESPLHEAVDRQEGVTFLEGKQLIKEAMELDGSAVYLPRVRVALRDALKGIKFRASWMNEEAEIEAAAEERVAAEQQQAMLEQANQGAQAAERLGKASAALAG